jgi:hypothetical protein
MRRLKRAALIAALISPLGCSGGSSQGTGGTGGGGQGGAGGTSGDAAPPGTQATPGDYYPVKIGSTWLYRVTENGGAKITYKRVTIEAMENTGGMGPNAGKPAIRHLTCKGAVVQTGCDVPPGPTNPVDKTVGWWGVVESAGGKAYYNYREQAFTPHMLVTPVEEDWWDPYRIKFDGTQDHMKSGASYTEKFTEYKLVPPAGAVPSVENITWSMLAVNESVTIMANSGAPKTYQNCVRLLHTTATGQATKTFIYCLGVGKVKESGGQIEDLIDYKIP